MAEKTQRRPLAWGWRGLMVRRVSDDEVAERQRADEQEEIKSSIARDSRLAQELQGRRLNAR